MSTYEQAAVGLRDSLIPLRDYCNKERERLDPSDPKHQFRFKHVQQLEAAREAARDYYLAVEAIINPKPTPFEARVKRHIAFYTDPAPFSRAKLDQHFPFNLKAA